VSHLSPAASQPITISDACEAPSGVTWDGDYLWVTDLENGRLWRIDPGQPDPASQTAFTLPGVDIPGPMAYDANENAIWIVDNPGSVRRPPAESAGVIGSPADTVRRRIVRVPLDNLDALGPEDITSIPVPPRATGLPVTDLTWDGSMLWLTVKGGLCASVYCIDQANNGEVLAEFFPRSEPVGLTIDRVGNRFWLAADGGWGRGPLLIERVIAAGDHSEGTSVPSYRSQRYLILRPPNLRPRGIVSDGNHVWVLDVSQRHLLPTAPPGRLFRYRVR